MREQQSSLASRNFHPSRTATDSTPFFPDSNSESHNPATCISGEPDRGDGIPDECDQDSRGLPRSSILNHGPLRLLLVDDNIQVRNAFSEFAASLGFMVEEADDTVAAREILARKQTDIVLLDVTPKEGRGRTLLEETKVLCPEAPVIVMSAGATIESAVKTMQMGAFDYLSKPLPLHVLSESLVRAVKRRHFNMQRRQLQETLSCETGMKDLLGQSPEMEKLYRILSKVSDSRHPVMILGEKGTGKRLVAKSIHSNGTQGAKPFVSVDCKTLGPVLLERELFGHVEDASDESTIHKLGALTFSRGGTLFLDEIGDMPMELQGRLARAIKEKCVRPIGETKAIPISVRILAATTHDPTQMVREGRFRMDLLQLLSVVNLRIPPLRARPDDIAFLAKRFLEKIQDRTGIKRTLSDETLRILETYDWPDNVRELERSIVRACTQTTEVVLRPLHLSENLLSFHRKKELESTRDPSSEKRAKKSLVSIAHLERQAILEAIQQMNGDKQKAAQLLGIGKTTLYRKLKAYKVAETTNSLEPTASSAKFIA